MKREKGQGTVSFSERTGWIEMKNKRKMGERVGFVFALPAAIYMLVFVGYPMIENFILSFKNVDVYSFSDATKQSVVGLQNYIELFAGKDGVLGLAIINTLIF